MFIKVYTPNRIQFGSSLSMWINEPSPLNSQFDVSRQNSRRSRPYRPAPSNGHASAGVPDPSLIARVIT